MFWRKVRCGYVHVSYLVGRYLPDADGSTFDLEYSAVAVDVSQALSNAVRLILKEFVLL